MTTDNTTDDSTGATAGTTPPEDRRRSPYTGWTRRHWEELADRMLAGLDRHRSPAGARYAPPGPASLSGPDSDGLEGFARSFLLAGFRVVGERGADPAGWLERYAAGLAAGTDPGHPEYWPRPDLLGQAKVEAASLALVLQMTRPWLWDLLDDAVRDRVLAWFGTVVGQPYPPNNWLWFRVVVESFLREAGGEWSPEDVEADLALHASLRRADGWLTDRSCERAYDHYAGWALHLYPLLWTEFFDVTGTLCPPALRATWAADLARYLDDAVRMVGADGSPLLQGRSLVYRFAAAAPLWVGALAGVGGPAPGLTRRAASGMVRHFAHHGAPDGDGLLSLGWHGPWPAMRQTYSGPASPYWASKGMLGLALPADHPVWTAVERPLPVEEEPVARVVAAPGWLLAARREDDVTIVLNHGTDHAPPGADWADSPIYARLGYSTATVPPLTGPSVADPVDNAVVVLDDHGRATHRSGFETLYAERLPGGVLAAASRGRVRWVAATPREHDHGYGYTGAVTPGPVVTVASVVRDGVEVRLARVDAGGDGDAEGRSAGGRAVRIGGWPVASDSRPSTGPGARATTAAGLHSRLVPLLGLGAEEAGGAGVTVERDTSPLGAWTAIPWLATTGPLPLGEVLAAAVVLTRSPRAADAADPAVTVAVGGRTGEGDGHGDGDGAATVVVTWSDGLTTEVSLPPAA
ncbi:DUF2264 domain-containing protein [Streptomyces sp. 4N509B]|uniref:DUF2264 domain-containing protein n=1 Tax=Streptomyces sp. 4N509B TaxID=3457413 RepID=UPI003FD63573